MLVKDGKLIIYVNDLIATNYNLGALHSNDHLDKTESFKMEPRMSFLVVNPVN